MGLKIAIPKETASHERRVSASPDTVKKYIALGCDVIIESDAGIHSDFTDDAYKNAGAKIAKNFEECLKGADIILKVAAPSEGEIKSLPKGASLFALLNPYMNSKILKALASAGINAFSLEFVPRISRAQSMDVLSSQSNLAGYKAVLDATEHYAHAMPMMMTAAGTVPAAKVFVMGAGVAGLQAIATARRLGAVVSATDVRPAAKEQVQSLGANFIAVEDDEFKQAETAGGYAKEMSDAYKAKQAALIETHLAKQDIVITTALIPGRPAPKLITSDMVKTMKTGSVIVDIAAETGGNCADTVCGEVIKKHGVTIVGHANMPSRLAADASALYAKNLLNLLTLMINKDTKEFSINLEDEIIRGIAMIKDGIIIHPNFADHKDAPVVIKPSGTKPEPKKKKTDDDAEKPKASSRKRAGKKGTEENK